MSKSAEAITVGVRLRPFVHYEQATKSCIQIANNVVSVVGGGDIDEKHRQFAFDYAMDSSDSKSAEYVSQEKVYELMGKRMKDHMMQGFNTCLFCYGQTGTGKTTTIMGQAKPVSEQGLLMRLLYDFFDDIEKQRQASYEINVKVQMLEVYNEKLKDLLTHENDKKIDVHVHPVLGVYVKGATMEIVDNFMECIKLIDYGNTMKSVRATAMNKQSSRGHTIFRLNMERSGGGEAHKMTSEVYFADLAGRENEKTTQVTGEGRVELSFINKSLMFLASCIQSLGTEASREQRVQQSSPGVGDSMNRKVLTRSTSSLSPDKDRTKRSLTGGSPRALVSPTPKAGPAKMDLAKFRNSKLTLLLSNALSGNSKTAMIGTLSPSLKNFDETISTLKFASTVKTIKLQAKAATVIDKDQIVASLQEEVARLKAELSSKQQSLDVDRKMDLENALEATQSLATFHSQDVGQQRLQALANKNAREQALRRQSIAVDAFDSDAHLPHLANYADDPYLAFRFVLYVPPDEKEYSAGTKDTNKLKIPPGPGVCSTTCHLRNSNGRIFIRAAKLEETEKYDTMKGRKFAHIEVNDNILQGEEQELNHLDKVIFGSSTVFFTFKTKATAEELENLRLEAAQEECPDEQADSVMISNLLGERSEDPIEVSNAEKYLVHLRQQHSSSESQVDLKIFLHNLKRYKKMCNEANDITATLRPNTGLGIELSTQAPIMGYGYGVNSRPEICARLVRRISPARARWHYALERVRHRVAKNKMGSCMDIFRSIANPTRAVDLSKGRTDVLALWTWSTFEARLELMRDYYESYSAQGPDHELRIDDPCLDPWSARSNVGGNAIERASIIDIRKSAVQVNTNLKKQLIVAAQEKNELEQQLEVLKTASHQGGGSVWGVHEEIKRCLDLSRGNQAMAESFVQMQSQARDERKMADQQRALMNRLSRGRLLEVTKPAGEKIKSALSLEPQNMRIAIFVVLKSGNSKFTILVRQAQTAAHAFNGRSDVTEIPSGVLGGDGHLNGAALQELKEAARFEVQHKDLIDMTNLAYGDNSPAPCSSGGRADDTIRFFLLQRNISAEELAELQRRHEEPIKDADNIALKIIPFEDLWRMTSDSKALSALCLHDKLVALGKIPNF